MAAPPPPPIIPDTLDEHGLIDSNWFKVVITKCPSGDHVGTASVSLDRWYGQWHTLPEAAFMTSVMLATSLVPIKDLILRKHRLTSLPLNMAAQGNHLNTSLIVLDISSNCFETLPAVVCQFLNLQRLNASGNGITSLPPDFSRLIYIETLNLNKNAFESFPLMICNLKNLHTLSLEDNNITQIPDNISGMTGLNELYLKSNKMSQLPDSICQLGNLHTIHVTDNCLVSLPDAIGDITSLKQLHLAQNNLTCLPLSLATLPLQGLTLTNNPLIRPPQQICRRGLAAITTYLRELTIKTYQRERTEYSTIYETDV